MNALRALVADWLLARYLARRARQDANRWVIVRASDRTLWTAGCPQDLVAIVKALLDCKRGQWHFNRVRIWRGVPIASRKTFWRPLKTSDFHMIYRQTIFVLPPLAADVEARRIALLESAGV